MTGQEWRDLIWLADQDVIEQSRNLQKKMRFEEQIPGAKALTPEKVEEILRPYQRRMEQLDWAKRLTYVIGAMDLDGPDPVLRERVEQIIADIMSLNLEVQR